MRMREGNPFGKEFEPKTLSLGEIWSALTSEVGGILGETTSTATPSLDGSATATAARVTMPTTVKVPVPVSTVTVDTTVLQTSFTTIHVTTNVVKTSSTKSPSSSNDLPSIKSESRHTSLPAVVPGLSSSAKPSSAISHNTHQPSITPSTTANATTTASHTTQKHAIIGGLSGSIAGLVLIGVLICLCLRRRRKDHEDSNSSYQEPSFNEKGLRPVLARKWSEITNHKTSPRPPPPVSRGSTTPDLDGHVIRMSLEHWPRPFLHGEGFRESVGPGQLRVMNPDLSRPTTPAPPRGSAESPAGFLKRQRSALAAVLLGAGGGGRSRASSRADSSQYSAPVPSIEIDRAASPERERAASSHAASSFRSYSSATLPVVNQHPLEDPFLTPPEESPPMPEPLPQARTRRPSLAPLQSVAGAASRTLSHLSNTLNPFRSRSDLAESMASASRHSISTFSSAGDPFKLDRPSIRGSFGGQGGRTASEFERQYAPNNLTVYEGT